MIYLIYGQDLPKINYYLDKLKFENPNGEQIRVDFPVDEDFANTNLYTPPMLADKRLVIFENLTNFAKIDFSQIHSRVDVVILQQGKFHPLSPKVDNLIVIEAKRLPLIFKFLDNLFLLPQAAILTQLFQILKTEDPNFIFHQLISHFRNLILAKEGFFVKKLGDWQIRKYQNIAYRLTLEQLKTAYKLILAAEIEVKTGKQELTNTLPVLVLRLTKIFKSL